jgi:hypothetical protein
MEAKALVRLSFPPAERDLLTNDRQLKPVLINQLPKKRP